MISQHARLATGAAVIAALALPSAASAKGTVIGGPLKVRAYQMTLVGSDAAKDTLSVVFNRTAGTSSQQHVYTFDRGVKVTSTSISGKLGRFGAVNLKLTSASSVKGTVPKGCTGKPGSTKRGTLTGSFKLVADTTYFKTLKAGSLRGSSSTGGSLRCDGPAGPGGPGGPGAGGPTLSMTDQTADGMLTFSATKRTQTAMRMDDAGATAPARVMHLIAAQGGGLAVSGGDTATVKGISPFLAGTGNFSGERAGSMATGELSGNLFAKFDSIGAIALEGDAMLMGG
ncbi:MAG TPA: hypothetical protein VFR97_07585 [Capillimicrobium sp.]|nr:hypothetical protein [Capillimicrobium sp.]